MAAKPKFIYTPAESTTRFVQYVNHLYDTPGIKFGVPSIDKKVLPMRPGEVIGITGRPGHGKSSLQSYFALQEAKRIIADGTTESEIVLYVTWEQSVEVQELFFQAALQGYDYSISDLAWGRADRQKVIEKAIKNRVSNPIWIAGVSLMHQDATENQPMYIETLFGEIERIQDDHGVKPTLICFDYLQRVPVQNTRSESQRNLQVAAAIMETSNLAKRIGCPILLGVQAKAEVDHRDNKIPMMGDAYYSAELAHVVDKHFGIMKPIKYYEKGHMLGFTFDGQQHHIPVDDNTLLVQLDKQRLEQGMRRFAIHFDMARMRMGDFDFININDEYKDPEFYRNGKAH
jgi:replicative DNA helicase